MLVSDSLMLLLLLDFDSSVFVFEMCYVLNTFLMLVRQWLDYNGSGGLGKR